MGADDTKGTCSIKWDGHTAKLGVDTRTILNKLIAPKKRARREKHQTEAENFVLIKNIKNVENKI